MARTEGAAARVGAAVKAHAPAVLAYFTRRVDQSHDAADLLAETLLIVWRRSASLPDADEQIRPWMFGIARNVLLHHYRGVGRRRAVADRLRATLQTTPHAGFADPTEHDDLHRALAHLDSTDRDIIGLVHWDGFTLVEVSRILGKKEGTVRSRYHRARAILRAQLRASEPPPQAVYLQGVPTSLHSQYQ